MKKILNMIGIFFSILIAIIIFTLETLLITNVILNKFVSEEGLAEIIEEIISYRNEDGTILLTLADNETTGTIQAGKKINFKSIEGKIKNYLVNAGFTGEEASEIVRDEEFRNIVNNYLESMVISEIKDTEVRYPTKAEVQKFIQKNYNALKKIKVISEKYNENTIDKYVEENYDNIKIKLEEITEEVKIPEIKEISYLKKIINLNPIILILLIIVSIGLLIAVRASVYKWLIWFSIPTFLVGLIFSGLGLFGMKLISSFKVFDNYEELINPIAKKMSTMMIKYGIIAIVITIVLLVIYIVVKSKSKEETGKKKPIKK